MGRERKVKGEKRGRDKRGKRKKKGKETMPPIEISGYPTSKSRRTFLRSLVIISGTDFYGRVTLSEFGSTGIYYACVRK